VTLCPYVKDTESQGYCHRTLRIFKRGWSLRRWSSGRSHSTVHVPFHALSRSSCPCLCVCVLVSLQAVVCVQLGGKVLDSWAQILNLKHNFKVRVLTLEPRLVHDGIAAHPAAILLPVGEHLAQRNIPHPTAASRASVGLKARLQTLEITNILPSR
jgi:hypothetical protein